MANFLSLGAVIFGLRYSHYDLRVVIYSFVFGILTRFLVVEILLGLYQEGEKKTASLFTSPPPPPGEAPAFGWLGLSYDSSWDYFGSVVAFGLLTFTFVNNLDYPGEKVLQELEWALAFTGIYCVKDLLSRSVELDFKKSREENLRYNSQPLQVLFLSCAAGLFIYVFIWHRFHHAPDWYACGPFLLVKHGTDLVQDMGRFARRKRS